MSPGVPTKVIAACTGLCAFATALIAGVAADNPAEIILGRAILAMLVCQAAGWVAGLIGERVVREALASAHLAASVHTQSTISDIPAVDSLRVPRVV